MLDALAAGAKPAGAAATSPATPQAIAAVIDASGGSAGPASAAAKGATAHVDAKPATGAAVQAAIAPDALAVIDTSDTSADLVWAPVNGAQAYSVSRASAEGPFAVVGRVRGPSFGDAGLAPKSTYRWRVSVVIDGVEGPASNEVQRRHARHPRPVRQSGLLPASVMARQNRGISTSTLEPPSITT